ncbi:WxL domain-containing protein [Carnobacterium gallinarum]|uniref:WxL domain-containing protein n=1 Tax=Carnobacterium gallinarum TaxID=2749 RepID=UPI00054E34DB|nr:WxL domain-containing protein [Carnobacterium gallinarum]
MKLTTKSLIGCVTLGALLLTTAPTAYAINGVAPGDDAHTEGRVDFVYESDDANPVDPLDPTPKPITPVNPGPNPGTKGVLRIDLAPNVVFKDVVVSGTDQTSFAKAVEYNVTDGNEQRFSPNFLQVTDIRGNKFGWKVSAQASNLMKYDKDTNGNLTTVIPGSEVVGAKLTFKQPTILSKSGVDTTVAALTPSSTDVVLDLNTVTAGSASMPMLDATISTAEPTKGYGIWTALYAPESQTHIPAADAAAYENENISLFIPASAHKSAGSYKADITWTMEETP